MARNLKNEDAARYHKIQESKVSGLWVEKGENAKFEMIPKTDFP